MITANTLLEIIKNVLTTNFLTKERAVETKTLLREIYPNFVLLSNTILFENLIGDAIGQSIKFRGKISLANSTVGEVIECILSFSKDSDRS